jgi:hypothetical protein
MSDTPDSRRYSFDDWIDAVVEEKSIHFTFKDQHFTIPPSEMWPDRLPSPLRAGYDALGRAVLGDDQWERFAALGGTGRQLNSFFDHVTRDSQGVGPGESSASDES